MNFWNTARIGAGSIAGRAILVLALSTGVVAAMGTTGIHAQTVQPGFGQQAFEQVEITEDGAKNALRAYRELKSRFEDQVPSDSGAKAYIQAMMASDAMRATAAKHGFEDVATWHRTLMSFVLAYSAGVRNDMSDTQQSLQKLRDAQGIPEATKKQMIAQFEAFLPSEQNVEVARAIAADPDCAELIAAFDE